MTKLLKCHEVILPEI